MTALPKEAEQRQALAVLRRKHGVEDYKSDLRTWAERFKSTLNKLADE